MNLLEKREANRYTSFAVFIVTAMFFSPRTLVFRILIVFLCLWGVFGDEFYLEVFARVVFQSEFYSEQQDNAFIIDVADDVVGSNVAIQFGNSLGQTLEWDVTESYFAISDTLNIEGEILMQGEVLTLNANSTGNPDEDVDIVAEQGSENSGVLRYDDGLNAWMMSNDGVSFDPLLSGGTTFAGAGTTGVVADPGTENNYFLRDDGNWAQVYAARDIGFFQINAGQTGVISVTGVGFEPTYVQLTLNNDIETINFDTGSAVNNNTEQGSFGWGKGYAMDNGGGIEQQAQFFSASSNSINAHRGFSSNTQALLVIASDQNGNDVGRIEGIVSSFTADGFDLNVTTNTMTANYVFMYEAQVASGTEIQFVDSGTQSETFTIDNDNTGGVIGLIFGQAANEYLQWNPGLDQFEFSNDVFFGGNELRDVSLEKLNTDPEVCSVANEGRFYYNTTTDAILVCNGISWVPTATLATADMPVVQARRTTDFTIASINTWTDVPIDTTDVENDSTIIEHNAISTDRIDVKEDGLYQVYYRVNHNNGGATHNLQSRVRINDSTVIPGSFVTGTNYQNEFSPNSAVMYVSLSDGDFVTLQVQRTTANTVTNETLLSVMRLEGIKGDKGDPGVSVYTGATPPFACTTGNEGRMWHDTDTGLTYTCDISNGRDAWLSTGEQNFFGDENDTCASGQSTNTSGGCSVDWGNGLGTAGTTELGIYIPHDVTITGYGYSQNADTCTSGSFDVEVIGSGSNSNDNGYSFQYDIDTGLTGQTGNSNALNVEIPGNQYLIWGVDNNCGQTITDFNIILYYRIRGS